MSPAELAGAELAGGRVSRPGPAGSVQSLERQTVGCNQHSPLDAHCGSSWEGVGVEERVTEESTFAIPEGGLEAH